MLLLFVLFYTSAKSQSITSEEVWCFNTTVNQCEQLMKQHQPEIVLQRLQHIDAGFLKKAGKYYQNRLNTLMAKCYAEISDTAKCYEYYFSSLIGFEFGIKDLIKNESKINYWSKNEHPLFFLYQKYPLKFDSLYSKFLSDTLLQNKIQSGSEKIKRIMERDQYYRKGGMSVWAKNSDSIKIQDSLNMLEFIPLITNDTANCLFYSNFGYLLALSLHYTRYDTIIYQKIISYTIKRYGEYNFFITLLADNRSENKYNQSTYYDYLFKENMKPNMDFAKIDSERRKMGQSSLYFKYVTENIPIPDYYKENPIGPCY